MRFFPRARAARFVAATLLAAVAAARLFAQADPNHDQMPDMPGMKHEGMNMGKGSNQASDFLMQESSGTVFQPSAWTMPMIMTQAGHGSKLARKELAAYIFDGVGCHYDQTVTKRQAHLPVARSPYRFERPAVPQAPTACE